MLAEGGVELSHRRPRTAAHGHLRRLVLDDAYGPPDLPGAGVDGATDVPLGAATDDGDGPFGAHLGREGPQIHAPSGIFWRSPQRDPDGNTFSGIGHAVGVEGLPQPGLGVEVVRREDQRHVVALLQPDAVLARQHATRVYARGDDLLPRRHHPFEDAFGPAVEHDQGMQVAVAGVEHVHHHQLMAGGDLVDPAEDVDQLRAGDDGVVQVVVGGDAGDGAESRLAPLPQKGPLGVVGRHPHVAGAVLATDAVDDLGGRGHARGKPVHLDEQYGRRVTREAGVHEVLHRPRDLGVHHLEGGGDDAGGDDPRHGGGRVLDGGEIEQEGPYGRRVRRQAHGDPGGDAHRALAPDEGPAQVVTRRLRVETTEQHERAVG